MEPNAFKPYLIIDHTKTYLHLAEPKVRKRFLFFFFRIYPIILAIAITFIICMVELPVKHKLVLGGIGIILSLLFSVKNFIEEVKISNLEITITYQTFFGKKIKTIPLIEVEKITVETMIFSTTGGYYYRVKLKGNKKEYEIFSIPRWYINWQNKAKMNETLEEITGLKVMKW